MMSTLLKLGLSGYDVKPRFGAFQCKYLLQNPLFFLGKSFGDTRHPYEKNEPTLDHSGGGVHGKVCWLIAYRVSSSLHCWGDPLAQTVHLLHRTHDCFLVYCLQLLCYMYR